MTTGTGPAPALPRSVAVIGGGRMGAGIAQSFATAGAPVTVVEQSREAAEAVRERIAGSLERAAGRGLIDADPAEVLDRMAFADAVTGLDPATELVVEAVPEDAGLKAKLLAAAEQMVGEATVLATNTSSLSVTELAAVLERPARFLGLHFFNPVPASALIELVVADDTDPAVVDRALAWTAALGKKDVVVRDSPGFASSRLGVALGLEAIRMVEEGVASPADIDKAMEVGYSHPMGPLRLTDLVGLDVRLGIARNLEREFGSRFAAPPLLAEMVAGGRLGKKSGHGFFNW